MTQAEGDAKPDRPEPKRDEPAKTQASDEQLQRLKRRPPTAQDRYQLEGEIGRGGMGAVLRVRDLDRVNSATFNPDGTRVVTASDEHTAKVWDASSGKAPHTLDHGGVVFSAVFSPDGTRVVTASDDHTAKVWDASNGKALHTLEHGGGVYSATFSPDGTRVVTASDDHTAKVWDASSGRALHTFEHGDVVYSATFSPDGTRVVTANKDKTAQVWDASGGKALHTFEHGSSVYSAAFSPDGAHVATASHDHTAKVWDASSGKPLYTLEHGGGVNSVAFSPDGTRVVTASDDNTAKVWDASIGKALHSFDHGHLVNSATFSPEGTCVVTASEDGTAAVFSLHVGCTLRLTATKRDVAVVAALAEMMTGHTLSPESEFAPLTAARRQQDGVLLQEILEVPTAITPLAQWLTSQGPDSPAYPGASITCRQRADILIDGGPISAREALHLDPVHPLVHIALAAHEAVPEQLDNAEQRDAASVAEVRRAFLRDYDLRRLPADAGICARAASMLLQQGDKPRALTAANKALAIEPTNATALRVEEEAKR